jgi:hypothetical protein
VIDQGLVTLLAANAGVAAILVTGGAGSIYQGVVPEDIAQYPCLSYQFVGGRSAPTLQGSGQQRSRVQIDCWATTADAAKLLADAVRQALNGYQGLLSDGTFLLDAQILHPGIDYFSDDSRFFRRMLEFYLLYNFTN